MAVLCMPCTQNIVILIHIDFVGRDVSLNMAMKVTGRLKNDLLELQMAYTRLVLPLYIPGVP